MVVLSLNLIACNAKNTNGEEGTYKSSGKIIFSNTKDKARQELLKDKNLNKYAQVFADRLCEAMSKNKSEWLPSKEEVREIYDFMMSADNLEDGQDKVEDFLKEKYKGRERRGQRLAKDFEEIVDKQAIEFNKVFSSIKSENLEVQELFSKYSKIEALEAAAYLLKIESDCPYLGNFLESAAMKEK